MKTTVFALLLLCCPGAWAQHQFDIKNASAYFDIRITVATCEDNTCEGEASFAFFKKGSTTPYQIIHHDETCLRLYEATKPNANVTLRYEDQSTVMIGDYNFDGMEDVALCDGLYGSYGASSYAVYLSSRTARKFVHSEAFSALAVHLGMFKVDKKRKILRTFDKSGCCFHMVEEFTVVKNVPRRVLRIEENATLPDETIVKITTERLVKGKWRTQVIYKKR